MEKKIEKKVYQGCVDLGCYISKFVNPARTGAPDRLVLTPNGFAIFIEFKMPGEVPRREQIEHMLDLNRMGFLSFWATDAKLPLNIIRYIINNVDPVKWIGAACMQQIEILSQQLK